MDLPQAPKHIIWDWNGTLLDDAWLGVECFNWLLTARGLPILSLAEYRNHYGIPIPNYYRHLGIDLERERFEEVAAQFIGEYERRVGECKLMRGADEILRCGLQVSHAILSAHPEEELKRAVSHLNCTERFELIFGSRIVGGGDKALRGKELIRALGSARADDYLLVGDTVTDAGVARELGIPCALVACGHHSRERLEAVGAPVFGDIEEFGAALTEWGRRSE